MQEVHLNPLTAHYTLPLEIALHSKVNDCECFGCLSCLFNMCIRCDCISQMTLFQAIHRYEEEFILPVEVTISFGTLLLLSEFIFSLKFDTKLLLQVNPYNVREIGYQ